MGAVQSSSSTRPGLPASKSRFHASIALIFASVTSAAIAADGTLPDDWRGGACKAPVLARGFMENCGQWDEAVRFRSTDGAVGVAVNRRPSSSICEGRLRGPGQSRPSA